MHRNPTATTLAALALTLLAPACSEEEPSRAQPPPGSPAAVDPPSQPGAPSVASVLPGHAASCPFPIVVDGDEVDDLERIPQQLSAVVAPDPRPYLSAAAQARLHADYAARFWAPWRPDKRPRPAAEVELVFARFGHRDLWGQTLRPRPSGWVDDLAAAADLRSYPNAGRRAILVRHSAMRMLPTALPAFDDPTAPGEGFPFDYLQGSLLPAGTPLFVSHVGADGEWLYVESHLVSGWIAAQDVAWVGDDFARDYRAGEQLVAILDDTLPVRDNGGLFRFRGRLGAMLPLASTTDAALVARLPVRDADGQAAIVLAELPPDHAAPAPLPASSATLARLADPLLGTPYGWGGVFGDRDCSATMLDLMAPLGIHLPRNSARQAHAGALVDLAGLSDEAKRERIARDGVPFRTLLWKKGHILLYVGTAADGAPLALHTMWGIKTRDADAGCEARKLVARTVITTLEPGRERADYVPEKGILHGIVGMTLLAPDAEVLEPPTDGSDLPPEPAGELEER